MCIPKVPKAPAATPATPIPRTQAAKAPDQALLTARGSEAARRRFGMAATILTPPQLGAATTTGKSLLGQ